MFIQVNPEFFIEVHISLHRNLVKTQKWRFQHEFIFKLMILCFKD